MKVLTRNITYDETDMNNIPDVTIQYLEDDFFSHLDIIL